MACRLADRVDRHRHAFTGATFSFLAFVLAAPLPIAAQYAGPPSEQPARGQTPTMADCEQTDSAPLVVRACTHFLNTQELEPGARVRILTLRAVGWAKEDEFAAAADDYTSVLQLEPGNVRALEGRAGARAKLAQFAKAVDDYSSLIAQNPANDSYYRSRALAYLAARHYDEALADFDRSLELNAAEVEAYMGRAQVFNAMNEREKAKSEFEKGIKVNGRYLPLFWMRGEMARDWGDRELALESYAKVLAINSLHEDARRRMFNLGILHPP